MSATTEKTYAVKGMTCGHCQASVTEQVKQVPGVTGIDVELETGMLTVNGTDFSDDAIRAAVDEAGYEVMSA